MTTVISSLRRIILLGVLISSALLGTVSVSHAASFYYWDTNGSAAGAGSTPDGTWNEDPNLNQNWNTNHLGTSATQGWEADKIVVFAAGGDALGTYTVTVDGAPSVHDIHFDEGSPTLNGGTIRMVDGARLISAFDGVTATINSVIASKGPEGITQLTKYKPGTLILGGANTYSGLTIIEGGILQLAAADRIPNTSNLILANGDTRNGDGFTDTPATFNTGGFNETLGTLRLTGPNPSIARTLDLGHDASALVFANSSAENWEGIPLTIVNYTFGVDSLRFGTDSSGLTETQLASIVFADFGGVAGTIDANGFVTPLGPTITEVTGAGTSNTVITWTAINGRTYRVQYKLNLNETSWTDLPPDVFAVSSTASTTDDTSNGNERYYRVVLLP